MKKVIFSFIFSFLILRILGIASAAAWRQVPQNLSNYPDSVKTYEIPVQESSFGILVQPVTGQCLTYASTRFNIPVEALFLILDIERGEIGKISWNKNGTYDIGPMQINSCHLKSFEKAGITRDMLLYNGCVNVLAGSYLLFGHAKMAGDNNWLEIIGRYHSRTPEKKIKYQAVAIKRWQEMEADAALKILNRANGLTSFLR